MDNDQITDSSSALPESQAPGNGVPQPEAAPQEQDPQPEPLKLRFRAAGADVELDQDKVIRYAQKGIGAERHVQEANQKVQEAEQQLVALRDQMTDYDGYTQLVSILRQPHNAVWWSEFQERMRNSDQPPPQRKVQPVAPQDDMEAYFEDDAATPSQPVPAQVDNRWGQLDEVMQKQNQVIMQMAEKLQALEQAETGRTQAQIQQDKVNLANRNHQQILFQMAKSEVLKDVPDQQFLYKQIFSAAKDLNAQQGDGADGNPEAWDIPLAAATVEQHYKKFQDRLQQSVFEQKESQMNTFAGESAGSVPDVAEPAYVPQSGDLDSGKTLKAAKDYLRKMGYTNM